MTLNVNTLVTELRKFCDSTYSGFEGFPASKAAAKTAWADAYDTYASSALDVSGDALVTANKPGFKSQLLFDSSNTAAEAASEYEAAFIQYWTGTVFAIATPPTPEAACTSIGGNGIFGIETSSIVSTITPNVLKNLLLPVMSDNTASLPLQKIQDIANAFHTATTTAVFVLITGTDTTPTPSGPLPITNTCTIT